MMILICRDDGGVSIMEIGDGNDPQTHIAKWEETFDCKAVSWKKISAKDIPQDRNFRDAWQHEKGKFKVCMHKCREIHMSRIREKRNQKFIELGFPNKLNPQLENAVIDQETRNKLQALRSIPQTIDLTKAETPEQLKNIWPIELKE